VSPSSSGTITVDGCEMSKSLLGIITVDINGEEEPNTPYKDQFNFPISSKGIEYEMMCQEGSAEEEKEDITCEEAYAIQLQNCEKISEFVTPEFCATLPGVWVYERGYTSCRNPSKCGLDSCYFDTEEEYKALQPCSVSGIEGDPSCKHKKCNAGVGSSYACPLD
ncbi:MAG: hypothetical protein IJB79_00170, partial [Candidatus Gastranaerophilales bacterium]|nr:hypothetical protein [Candidatus Gastranaerophilales bacterium]